MVQILILKIVVFYVRIVFALAIPIKDLFKTQFAFTFEDKARLEHHGARLGLGMNQIARIAINELLNKYDEQEAFTLAHKAARMKENPRGRIAKLPTLQESSGLGIEFGKKKEKEPFPEKIKNSFPRLAKYVEDADGDLDHAMRLDECLSDMRKRCDESEATAGFLAFKDFLALRKEAIPPKKILPVPEGVPVFGDVE